MSSTVSGLSFTASVIVTDVRLFLHFPVHELTPADIKVVAAVGDSLTAGNGIASSQSNILDVLTQYRGLSWSVGGDGNLTTVTTLPNILKYFNPNLTGYSVRTGGATTPDAFFNQAVPGSKSRDVPSQVEALVQRMKADSRINFELDWKVITLFIGGNDMCDHCYNSLLHSVENYRKNVRDSLDYLHKEVPRALVNLVEVLYISPLREMHLETSLNCPTWLVNYMCPCVILPEADSKALQMVEELNRKYQETLHELVESGRYDTSPDFTVVIQPFFRDVVVPRLEDGRPDRSYFSADCFHLSQKAQTLMARSLWNNMLEPLGSKTAKHDFSATVGLKCPTKNCSVVSLVSICLVLLWFISAVHKLRPADIKVVAALGDYITVISRKVWMRSCFRFFSLSSDILKKFNPLLKGFSKGTGSNQRAFNMAEAGAKTSDIPGQVQALIEAMRADVEVNFETDWKLVTVFIGGTDLCHYCLDQDNLSPSNYSHNLMLALDILYREVPRVLVNVVEVMEMEVLRPITRNTLACALLPRSVLLRFPVLVFTSLDMLKNEMLVSIKETLVNDLCFFTVRENSTLASVDFGRVLKYNWCFFIHKSLFLYSSISFSTHGKNVSRLKYPSLSLSLFSYRSSCPCVINPSENSPEFEEIKRINYKYQVKTFFKHLFYHFFFEDFAVVLQPFLQNSIIPSVGVGEPDTTLFALDCFHMSQRAQEELAIALWNNMLEPVGQKQTYNNFTRDRSKISCPSETTPPPVLTPEILTLPNPELTTRDANCPETLPVWATVVVGVGSLLVGVFFTWLIMYCCCRSRKPKEQKGSGF
uniref:Phospholipase B1, membrane-associated n=1 Tax=Salarias fasciatus TaxID=181472 RepID=A0A672J0Y6_SALFA